MNTAMNMWRMILTITKENLMQIPYKRVRQNVLPFWFIVLSAYPKSIPNTLPVLPWEHSAHPSPFHLLILN